MASTRSLTAAEASGDVSLPRTRSFSPDNLISQRRCAARLSAFEFAGRTFAPGPNSALEDEPRRHGRLAAASPDSCSLGNTLRYIRYLDDFPVVPDQQHLDGHAHRAIHGREDLRGPDQHEGHRALPPHDHRSRRPRPRPDLRLRHDRLRRRAVGPALDHDRHQPRRARARPVAPDGREVPVLPPRRLGGRHPQGGRAHRPGAAEPDPDRPPATSAAASCTSACRT